MQWIKSRITEEHFLNLRWTTGLAGAASPVSCRAGYSSRTRTVPACAALGQLAMPTLARCRERPSLKAELRVWLRVTDFPGSELAGQARASCPARWGSQGLRLSELHRRRCPNRSAAFTNPRHPAAGAVQASWEHWQLPSDNDTPVRFMAAISSGGADKHLYTIQHPGGREGRTVSWGAELEPQTSFWDVSENTSIFFFKFPFWGYFYKFDWTTTKKKKSSQIESPVLQPAPLCSLIALKQRPCVVFSQGYMGRWNERQWRKE